MASGRDGDAFQPRWLAVALPALLAGRTAEPTLDQARSVARVEGDPRVLAAVFAGTPA